MTGPLHARPGPNLLECRTPQGPHRNVHWASSELELIRPAEQCARGVPPRVQEPNVHVGAHPLSRIQRSPNPGRTIESDVAKPKGLSTEAVFTGGERQHDRHPQRVSRPMRRHGPAPRYGHGLGLRRWIRLGLCGRTGASTGPAVGFFALSGTESVGTTAGASSSGVSAAGRAGGMRRTSPLRIPPSAHRLSSKRRLRFTPY